MNVEHRHVMASSQQGRAQLWPTHYLMLFVFTVRTKFQFYDYLLNSFMGVPERTAVQAKGAQSSLFIAALKIAAAANPCRYCTIRLSTAPT